MRAPATSLLVLLVLAVVDAVPRRQAKPIRIDNSTTTSTTEISTISTITTTTTVIPTSTPALESRTGEETDEYLLYPKVDGAPDRIHAKEEPETNVLQPTKYHYYPHNQHLYFLPECATQQVCSAVYLRLNYTQPLCACPEKHQDPCSVSINSNDRHTVELITDMVEKPLTIIKTCELVQDVRECRTPRDWSLLALQNIRTGKSHYLVICRCPIGGFLDGPMIHNQPIYARVPGIRVYGMICKKPTITSGRRRRFIEPNPSFPWHKLQRLLENVLRN